MEEINITRLEVRWKRNRYTEVECYSKNQCSYKACCEKRLRPNSSTEENTGQTQEFCMNRPSSLAKASGLKITETTGQALRATIVTREILIFITKLDFRLFVFKLSFPTTMETVQDRKQEQQEKLRLDEIYFYCNQAEKP